LTLAFFLDPLLDFLGAHAHALADIAGDPVLQHVDLMYLLMSSIRLPTFAAALVFALL